eukprot:CAMPEP_0174853594 /NCGR_PEP_ID=MMETSP1114-20130205/29033_1 /TAXON_ID=312471 /ORGANISM="Neobodo designis, Strain CCAP 1951/1" /LENGTH=201 /DNA_ID=CAMNT_0016088249 /DNA_START=53 /DNA_END=658 /DNA_ORIENTATION=+
MAGTRSLAAAAGSVPRAMRDLGLAKLPANRAELKKSFVAAAKASHPDSHSKSKTGGAPSPAEPGRRKASATQGAATVDMGVLTDAFATLKALYDKDTGELTPDAHLIAAGLGGDGKRGAVDRHGFDIELDESVKPHAARPEDVAEVHLPWLRGRSGSENRARAEAAPVMTAVSDAIDSGVDALKAKAKNVKAAFRFVVAGY